MALLRLAVAVVAAAFAVAACGGGGEAEDVKEDLSQFLADAERGDAEAVCQAITPESRRMLDVLGRGLHGADGACAHAMEENLDDAAGGISAEELEEVEAADVDVQGDRAGVEAPDDDVRVPMRKVDDSWVVDLASVPEQRYSLRASATCTELNLRGLRAPLPEPTREGIAGEAARDADSFDRYVRTLERLEPPDDDNDDEHERYLDGMRANAKDWRRAASALRGFGTLDAYAKALAASARRSLRLQDEQRALAIACLGMAPTLQDAGEYRRSAERTCGTAVRRLKRVGARGASATAARRSAAIGRRAAAELKRLDPPESLATLHRRSADALAETYAELPRLASARDAERAEERYGLLVLRSASGFLRIGLDTCAQL